MFRRNQATRPRVAFALSGGCAHGAAQVGMLQALFEARIVPDVLVGTSVGAMNAVYVAADPTAARARDLGRLWHTIGRREVFGTSRHAVVNALARRDHIYENTALQALIRRICPVIDLSDLAVETHVVTTDLDAGTPVWWREGPAAPVLLASTAIPGVFPPVLMPGRERPSRHIDGGVTVPVPVSYAASLDVDVVYVLDVTGDNRPAPERLNAAGVFLRSFSISRYANTPAPTTLARPGQQVVVLPAPNTSGRSIRDFSNTAAYIEQAYFAASEMLATQTVA